MLIMTGLATFVSVLFFLYCAVSWLLPKLIAYFIKKKLKCDIRIGRILLPYGTMKDVYLSKNGYTVQIDEISFRSSLFASQVSKILTVDVRDIRINKNIENVTPHTVAQAESVLLDFERAQIHPLIITLAQFFGVHFYNINMILLRSESPEWLLHCHAAEVHLGGSVVYNTGTLVFNMVIPSASAKFLKHAAEEEDTCLAEISLKANLDATVAATVPFSVDYLILKIECPKAVITEGFFSFIQQQQQQRQRVNVNDAEFRGLPGFANDIEVFKDLLKRFSPCVPKIFKLMIEESTMIANTSTKIEFTMQKFSLETHFRPAFRVPRSYDIDPYSFNFCPRLNILQLRMKSCNESFLATDCISICFEIQEKKCTLHVTLTDLELKYDHTYLHDWITKYLSRRLDAAQAACPHDVELADEKPWWKEFILQYELKMNVTLTSVLCIINLPADETSTLLHIDDVKWTFENVASSRDNVNSKWFICDWMLDCGTWISDLNVKNFWWDLYGRPSNRSHGVLVGVPLNYYHLAYHTKGTAIRIGSVMAKMLRRSPYDKVVVLNFVVDTLRLEWSERLSDQILQLYAFLHRNEDNIPPNVQRTRRKKPGMFHFCTPLSEGKRNRFQIWTVLEVKNVNTFLFGKGNVNLVIRTDLVAVSSSTVICEGNVDGLKITPLSSDYDALECRPYKIMKEDNHYIDVERSDFRFGNCQAMINLCDTVSFVWSPNFHLKVLTLSTEIKSFLRIFQGSPTAVSKYRLNAFASIFFYLRAKVKVECVLENHHLIVTTDPIDGCSNKVDPFSLNTASVNINIDGSDIFSIESLGIAHKSDDDEFIMERLQTDPELLRQSNLCWSVQIASLKIVFPYEHSFADAVHDEFINLVKWLKKIHKKDEASSSQPHRLPSDLIIKVENFLFEMSDDPFEVRLRDNYELLVDECKESLMRLQVLDSKVESQFKTLHLFAPKKVNELYENLYRKNAEVYIQRSKQIASAGPPRTRLFAWLMKEVKITALADVSFYGYERVTKIMKTIDPDSPWPDEGLSFSTLWCRSISARCKEWKFQLRDFPQPLMVIKSMNIFGVLVGAEQEATHRAMRTVTINLGEPWGKTTLERSMTSLKFYHDFNSDIEYFSYAFGPCWEPVIAQCNLSFEKILAPSRDPSPSLPFWDKMRYLFHGRLTMVVRQMTVLLHASLDPYNTTEEMEVSWNDLEIDWTNAKLGFRGNLNVYVRTASKYDDCRLLHIPIMKLNIKLNWVCLADPNDHHAVMPCAPDKLPEYSSNQEHDSYRAFRSQNLNINIALETKQGNKEGMPDCPVLVLYGSTLRWFENLKLILSGVTRPTRRGAVFKNVRPRKVQLSRHYRKVHILLGLHKFHVYYWMSFAMQRGFEITGGRVSSSSEHILTLVPFDDNLKHRPRADWSIMYMNCELNDAEIWLKSALQPQSQQGPSQRLPVEKCYFLSVAKVSYGRETVVTNRDLHNTSDKAIGNDDTPTHRLVVYDLKGAWTKSNRDVAFALFDAFMKTMQLKKNLSTEVLKEFRGERFELLPITFMSGLKPREPPSPPQPSASSTQMTGGSSAQGTPSPMTKLQSGVAATMLKQLIAEADNKAVVFSDDLSVETREQNLQGPAACQDDDVQHKNWLIALVNSQVLLKGCETKGYVIMSAAKAEILQRVHRPVWKNRTLVSKTTWVGSLDCMQYYATVSAGENDSLNENIMWLTLDNIEEKESSAVIADLPDVPHMVGSGMSVGGVVSETVGASNVGENPPVQLQRIVSRCRCEFFYAGYGESSIDPNTLDEVPPPPKEGVSPWEKNEKAVDAFTLMHHDLDICTNSLQYAMILDIINNLLLYVEPRRKEALERLQRMRFKLQLHSVDDQRKPIQQMQSQVRSMLSELRRLEREYHLLQQRASSEASHGNGQGYLPEIEDVERQVEECKEALNEMSEELEVMISCYKETQLTIDQTLISMRGRKPVTTVRTNEICFKHAQWRLTEADGQLGIADLVLSNFLYTQNSRSDDSGEHLLELGYVRMTNLLPNQIYTEVLSPTEIQSHMPVDRKKAVRVFCREKAPVGGISVKEHFEINVVPLTIGLTKKFFNTMLKFCFPERDPDTIDAEGGEELEHDSNKGKKLKPRRAKDTNFYVKIEQKDDVEKMKERAEKNKLFIYIKIPEVPVKVSYKGNKDKNLEDIRDFSLVIPTLEYHNVTWTWLDLLLAMKNDTRRVILSQAIKQKLQIKVHRGTGEEGASPQEEDKARMLFGHMAGDSKCSRRVKFKPPK